MGLTGYYRKFVEGYGSIARPLTDQLRKDRFGWTSEATTAFEKLKTAMVSVPVLALPDFNKQFVVETDASGYGLGAVLMQDQHPLAYYSQVLNSRSQLKSIYEKELMAIVLAVQKWRPYLLGRQIVVRTDQQSLKHLLEQRLVSIEYQKWLIKLLGYDFIIQYRPGVGNRDADALSRTPIGADCSELAYTSWADWNVLQKEVENDEFLSQVAADLKLGKKVLEFSLERGKLLYKGRLVLSRTSSLIPTFLREHHCSLIGGHAGEVKTYQRLSVS